MTPRRKQVLEAVARNKGNKSAAARELGLARATVNQHVHLELNGETRNGKGQVTSQSFGRPLADRPMDPSLILKGQSILRTGEDGRALLWWDKGGLDAEKRIVLYESLKEAFKEAKAPVLPAARDLHVQEDQLTYYPLADQHVGLLGWGKETGEDYDLAIGRQRLQACSTRLIQRSPASRLALIANLGDWYHIDDTQNATPTSGNRLDADGRFQKITRMGVDMMVDVIEKAALKHERVMVVNLPGNHDPHSRIILDTALWMRYREHPRIHVIDTVRDFYYHRFGVNLLGMTHGDKLKPQDMFNTFTNHEAWSETFFHNFYYGHYHAERVKVIGDARIMCVPSISGRDYWTTGKGWNGPRYLFAETFDLNEGPIGSHQVNVTMEKWK